MPARDLAGLKEGQNVIDLAGFGAGRHTLYVSADGYASQWFQFATADGKVIPETQAIKLFQTRYVVLRYAFNPHGRELTGPDVQFGRLAVTHRQGLPRFRQDWQVWQYADEGRDYGTIPWLSFHRTNDGYGFADAPRGARFEDLTVAPGPGGDYQSRSRKAGAGLLLFCRVNGDRQPPGQIGFGKVLVEDVTLTKPEGIEEGPSW